jgi:NRPS condensation-like uncharacterized protein
VRFSPGHDSPFQSAYRLACVGLLIEVGLCWKTNPTWLLVICGLIGLFWLLRVPRRLRVVELAMGFFVLGAWGGGWLVGGVGFGVLLITLLAPEHGLARLNGMDYYMVVEERKEHHPNSQQLLDTDRPLDAVALERALDSLIDDVPLLRSFIRESFLSAERFYTKTPWFRARDLISTSDDVDCDQRLVVLPFDLQRDPPLRMLVVPTADGGWRTILNVHHSLCDGTAQVVLFDALMRRYTAFLSGGTKDEVPVDHLSAPLPRWRDLLKDRGLKWNWDLVRKHVDPAGKAGILNASLLEERDAPEPTEVHRQVVTLEREQMQRLWEAAKGYRATLNHIYLAAALRAADGWRRARNLPTDRDYRILTPADLRPLLGLKPCLGNYSGIIELDLTAAQVQSDDVVATIRETLRDKRKLEAALQWPINLGVTSWLIALKHFRPILDTFYADPKTFYFTFGFTAIMFPSELCVPQDVEVRRMWMLGTPPRRPGLGMGPVRHGEQVNLVVAYRHPMLSDPAADDLLGRFRDEVERLVVSAPARRRRSRKKEALAEAGDG